jgi:hypothetical protein
MKYINLYLNFFFFCRLILIKSFFFYISLTKIKISKFKLFKLKEQGSFKMKYLLFLNPSMARSVLIKIKSILPIIPMRQHYFV